MATDLSEADLRRFMAILAKWTWARGGKCSCCGERADMLDHPTGACLPCVVDGAGSVVRCSACRNGGRTWTLLGPGEKPPVGAALRTNGSNYDAVEYALPVQRIAEFLAAHQES